MGNFVISTYTIMIGLGIIVIPFALTFIVVRKMISKKETTASLEERVAVLEAQVKELKEYIDVLEDM